MLAFLLGLIESSPHVLLPIATQYYHMIAGMVVSDKLLTFNPRLATEAVYRPLLLHNHDHSLDGECCSLESSMRYLSTRYATAYTMSQ